MRKPRRKKNVVFLLCSRSVHQNLEDFYQLALAVHTEAVRVMCTVHVEAPASSVSMDAWMIEMASSKRPPDDSARIHEFELHQLASSTISESRCLRQNWLLSDHCALAGNEKARGHGSVTTESSEWKEFEVEREAT